MIRYGLGGRFKRATPTTIDHNSSAKYINDLDLTVKDCTVVSGRILSPHLNKLRAYVGIPEKSNIEIYYYNQFIIA